MKKFVYVLLAAAFVVLAANNVRVAPAVAMEYQHICKDCDVLDLPPRIGENTHIVIQNDHEYITHFEYEKELPQIDFNQYALIGYTFRTSGSQRSQIKPQFYFEIYQQSRSSVISIIEVGPGISNYANHKKIIWFTAPKSLLPKSLSENVIFINYKHFIST